MGFTWIVNISLQFCAPIRLLENVSLWYLVKRLAEYETGFAKRAHQAMLMKDPVGKILLKKSTQCVIVLKDSVEYDENEVEKVVENPTPLEARFHYNPKIDNEREFELEYNSPEILQEAFEFAASKVLGDGHGISLEFLRGGAHGNADACAKETALFMSYKPLNITPQGEGIDEGRCGVNIPWGVYSLAVPTQPPPGVVQNIHKLMSAFGFSPDGEIGWRVITVADGG